MTVSNIFPGGGEVNLEFVQTCKTAIPQGVQQFCSFATLDLAKCDAAKSMQRVYELWAASMFL
jgi:hypothetical protein